MDKSDYWQASLANGWSLNYVQQSYQSRHMQGYPSIEAVYQPTLQVYGPGHYRVAGAHNAWTPWCGGGSGYWWYTNDFGTYGDYDVTRPSVMLVKMLTIPCLLGGALRSGSSSAQTTVSSAGNGAPGTPAYILTTGSQYGSLSCTNCLSTTYTATAPMVCGSYAVQIVASYGGFQPDPLWIFNNSPASMVVMGTYGYGLRGGERVGG